MPEAVREGLHLGVCPAVQLVSGLRALGDRIEQDEALDSLGRAGRDESHRTARAECSDESGPFHTDLVHDREDVIGLLLDRRRVGDAVGQSDPSALHQDRPGETPQTLEVVVDVGICPAQVEVQCQLHEVHDVDRALAHHLVRQCSTIAIDVVRGHRVHARKSRCAEPPVVPVSE
jgi:hypothetical protein